MATARYGWRGQVPRHSTVNVLEAGELPVTGQLILGIEIESPAAVLRNPPDEVAHSGRPALRHVVKGVSTLAGGGQARDRRPNRGSMRRWRREIDGPTTRAEQYQTPSLLRHPIVGRVENAPSMTVPQLRKGRLEPSHPPVHSESGHVLQHHRPRLKLAHQAKELEHQVVPVVADLAPPVQRTQRRESLTRGASRQKVELAPVQAELALNGLQIEIPDVHAPGGGVWVIQLVRRDCESVDVDGTDDAEARLPQSESQAAAAAEDIECGSSSHRAAAEASTLNRLGSDSESGNSRPR